MNHPQSDFSNPKPSLSDHTDRFNNHQPNDVAPPPSDDWTTVSMGSQPQNQPPPPPPPQQQPPQNDGPRTGIYGGDNATALPTESNPYVSVAPAPSNSSSAKTMDSVKVMLRRWGKRAAEATKKAEDLAGNMWQHLKTGPSLAEAAVGRIAQGTKVLAEGGHEKIFRQIFENVPEEKLLKTYACYLSTSAGPVMGTLYMSTAKLAFCSDDPLSYKVGEQTHWSLYKVVIPVHQLKAVMPTTSKTNPAEKFIQVISIDNHEFWFMGFVYYDNAVKNLQEALQPSNT